MQEQEFSHANNVARRQLYGDAGDRNMPFAMFVDDAILASKETHIGLQNANKYDAQFGSIIADIRLRSNDLGLAR